jgi:hypothetical protein
MGTVEDAVRREIQGDSALAELAYKLAKEIDLDAGGVAAIRELRAVLRAYRDERGAILPYRPIEPAAIEEDREEFISNGTYFRNGKWVRRIGGEWVPVEGGRAS